jgi:hypothetical protein
MPTALVVSQQLALVAAAIFIDISNLVRAQDLASTNKSLA